MRFGGSLLILLALLAASCNKSDIYSADKIRDRGTWFEPSPYGMVYIQRGSFQIGSSDDEIHQMNSVRSVSVDAFWMDDTEITNSEYRQFVHWVRDSIAQIGRASCRERVYI